MLRLSIILLFVCSYAFSQSNNTTGSIADGEGGGSVRSTLNDDLQKGNAQHDSLVVHRTELLQHYDSLAIHRTELLQQYDSLGIHRTELLQHYDSLGIHRTELLADYDSLVVHRTELLQHYDSIGIHRDTLTDHNTRIVSLESSVSSTDSSWTSITTDTIDEFTEAQGVLIDGLLIKDGGIGYIDDSIAQHRIELLQHYDSLVVHRTELLQHYDSLVVHRTELLQQYDSLVVHRTELLQHYDSIGIHRDTLTDHNTRILSLEATAYDTIEIDTIAHMLIDTIIWPGGAGLGITSDTTWAQVDANILEWPVVHDSVVFDSVYAYCEGVNGSITINLYALQSGWADDSPEDIIAADLVPVTATAAGTSTFSILAVGPGTIIRSDVVDVNGAGSYRPDKVRIYVYYHEKRAF